MAAEAGAIHSSTPRASTPRAAGRDGVREMPWGYVLSEGQAARDRTDLGLAILRFVGLAIVLGAYAQWLLPARLFAGDALVAKAALSFVLGSGGVALYWIGARRCRTDLHVDVTRREIRVTDRNALGDLTIRRVLAMGAVSSAYVARVPGRQGQAALYLSVRGERAPVLAFRGPEAEALAVHRRLAEDLLSPAERINRRLAVNVQFQSCRSVA